MVILTLFTRCFIFCIVTTATPQIAFPVNSQVPPLAQVAQPFDFQFSKNTFSSTIGASLSYSLQSAPAWLSIDSASQTLSGTPTQSDVGDATFQLTASDGSGSLSMPVTLVVSSSPPPQLTVNVTDVLSRSGPLCDIQSLSLLPQEAFSISFPENTFIGSPNLTYYATSGDRSPLPSWIRFDPTTLALSGIAPAPVPNPQIVPVRLIASDVSGFAGQSIEFNLVIGDHTFVFSSATQVIQSAPGSFVNISAQLLLDGKPAFPGSIASMKAVDPSWLQVDAVTLSISGFVPFGPQAHDIQVVASDIFNDNAYMYLRLGTDVSSGAGAGVSSTSPAARSIPTAQQTDAPVSSEAPSSQATTKPQRRKWLVAAIVGPVVIGLVCLICCVICIRYRVRQPSRDYVDNVTKAESDQCNIFKCRLRECRDVPRTAGRFAPDYSRDKHGRLSMAIATTSPMGSPEERLWNSQERMMSGLGVFVPGPEAHHSIPNIHPLRSNAIPLPPKRSSKRLSKIHQRLSHMDVARKSPQSRRSGPSWSPVVHGARFDQGRDIPRCENSDSDKLKCLDCGSRQVGSALEQGHAKRTSQMSGGQQPRIQHMIERRSFITDRSYNETEKERERREAEEYVSQPQSRKFQEFQKQRRGGSGVHERFSNSGSGSTSQSIRRWRSENGRRRTINSVMRCFSEQSASIPEEESRSERRHAPGVSEDSEESWETDRQTNSLNDLGDALGVDTDERRVDERGCPTERLNQHDYNELVYGVRMVERDEQVAPGMMEEYPSSDDRALV